MNAIELQMMASIGPNICRELDKKENANFSVELDVDFGELNLHCLMEIIHGRLYISGNFKWDSGIYEEYRKATGKGVRKITANEVTETTELEGIPLSQFLSMVCKYRMMLENWF